MTFRRTSSFLFRAVPAALWTGLILYALLSEPDTLPRIPGLSIPGIDKVIHAVLFGIEAVLVGRLIAQRLTLRSSYVVVLWCTVLGGVLELIQHYHVKGRMGEPFDLLADMAGALMGLALLRLLQRK